MSSADQVSMQNFPAQLASYLGLPTFAGEIMATIIIMSLVMVPILFFTRGRNPMLAFMVGFLTLCFGVAMTWVPIWIFAVFALLTAILFGKKIVEMF